MSQHERKEIEEAYREGSLDLLYVSPERLTLGAFREFLLKGEISLIVIDEAHCVCEWGHDFRPDYLVLGEALADLPRVPRIALTASASIPVREEIQRRLLSEDAVVLAGGFDRPNISLEVVPRGDVRSQLIDLLQSRRGLGASLVYCGSRAQTEEVSGWVVEAGIPAVAYHAGMGSEERGLAQDAFLSGGVEVAVATSAFGMGIDKADVATVAHLALPSSIEAYYQESGRAGRDGREALAWLAWAPADIGRRTRHAAVMEDQQARRREIARLESVLGYVETPGCRRDALLSRFGERFEEGCGRCDQCRKSPQLAEGGDTVRAVLTCVSRIDEGAGVSLVAETIAGLSTDRVKAEGLHRTREFGCLSKGGLANAKRLVRQCVGLGLLEIDDRTATLSVTQSGRRALSERHSILVFDDEARRLAQSARGGEGLPEWRLALWRDILELRREIAGRRNVSAQDILSDAAIARIVAAGKADGVSRLDPEIEAGLTQAVMRHAPAEVSVPQAFDTGLF